MKRNRSASVALVICFVAMIAIVGAITFSNYQKRTEEELAKAEEEMRENLAKLEEEEKESQSANTDQIQAEIPQQPEVIEPEVITPETPSPLSFSEDDSLMWPIEGNVVLNYSMDETIYFSTLDQYKYNPALVIGGEVGQEVRSAEEGRVTSVTNDAQTGNTVTVDLGDGYSAVYGQLGEVLVKEGERIVEGDILGYLGEPTKYYSVEGPNLYFQLLRNGEPVNPLEYLDV